MGQDLDAELAQLLLDREADFGSVDFAGSFDADVDGHGRLAAERSVIRGGSNIPTDAGSRHAGHYARNTGEGISNALIPARYPPHDPGRSGFGGLDHLEPVVQTRLEQGAFRTIVAICQAGFN